MRRVAALAAAIVLVACSSGGADGPSDDSRALARRLITSSPETDQGKVAIDCVADGLLVRLGEDEVKRLAAAKTPFVQMEDGVRRQLLGAALDCVGVRSLRA